MSNFALFVLFSTKNAEFISAMKTMQNLTFFMKTQKKKKIFIFVNWDFHWNSWADCHAKLWNINFRWKRRQIKQNYKFSTNWENRLNRRAITFHKITRNCAFFGNSINIHLIGYFCMQNSYLRWKQGKILRFPWKRKNNRK